MNLESGCRLAWAKALKLGSVPGSGGLQRGLCRKGLVTARGQEATLRRGGEGLQIQATGLGISGWSACVFPALSSLGWLMMFFTLDPGNQGVFSQAPPTLPASLKLISLSFSWSWTQAFSVWAGLSDDILLYNSLYSSFNLDQISILSRL